MMMIIANFMKAFSPHFIQFFFYHFCPLWLWS